VSDESIAPPEPPRQGLTYLRVMALAYALHAGNAVEMTGEELTELFKAWLRLTDIDPHWQQRGQADG
jgi:hypothetical protein